MFTKYGYSTMGVVFIVVFVLIAISIFLDNNFIRVPLLLLSAFLVIFTLNFFRDPERTVPNKSNIVVSPADGRILFVKDILDGYVYFDVSIKTLLCIKYLSVSVIITSYLLMFSIIVIIRTVVICFVQLNICTSNTTTTTTINKSIAIIFVINIIFVLD